MVVWYIEKDGEFVGVIARELADSWGMREEAQEYVDCKVWIFSGFRWFSMPTNTAGSAIWEEGKPPKCMLMVKMLDG